MDMMTWPIYPTIRFGGLRDYFKEAEKIRDSLPVVDEEMNFFAPGCYTTQSRIKRGNRRAEAAFYDVEALASLAEKTTDYRMPKRQVEEAWRDVLFTHFHDILTGSCVQDSREHAMGLFQGVAAVTNTHLEKAMTALAGSVDTAAMPVMETVQPWEKAAAAMYDTQSEGAGVGYGIEHFAGVPVAERGSGLIRVFHVYNTLPCARKGVVELTVWDYTGDMARVHLQDDKGQEIPCQMVDRSLQKYWDHRYFRILALVEVPALGYSTLVLRQKSPEAYPVYLQDREQVARFYDDVVLDNGIVRAVIDAVSGRVKSFVEIESGKEYIAPGKTAGLEYLETERRTSSAWNIGRTLKDIPVDKCTELMPLERGKLRQSVKATFLAEGGCRVPSKIEVTYALEAGSRALTAAITADWQEQGGDIIPVLTWKTPLCGLTGKFRYLIPAGTLVRGPLNNDVPGIAGAALREDGQALVMTSDSKYGFRGGQDSLTLTLINSSVSPDPYPERGIHTITLWLAAGKDDAQDQQAISDNLNHKLFYQPSGVHEGTLPAALSLAELIKGTAAITSVQPTEGGLLIRGYETAGENGTAALRLGVDVKSAALADLSETGWEDAALVNGREITFPVQKNAIWEIKVAL